MLTTTLIGMLVIFSILVASQAMRELKVQPVKIDNRVYRRASRHEDNYL